MTSALPARPGDPRRRCVALVVVVGLALTGVVGRLVVLTLLDGERFAERGVAQRLRTVPLPAERGSIFDRNGVELAMSVRSQTVYADPRLVDDPIAHAAVLAPVLDVDAEVLVDRLGGDGHFAYLARQVDDDVAARVEALALEGVGLLDEPSRVNPAEALAASVLGGVDLDNAGVSGLERQYDEALVGEPGELLVERDPAGRTIPLGEQRLEPPSRGDDLVLTIDRTLQFEVERALADAVAATGAGSAMAVVADPRTGEILAMATVQAGADGMPVVARENMALTAVFEPGSVTKVVPVAAALEEGIVAPGTTLAVPDRLLVGGHEYTDHDPHATEQWTMADVLAVSSNVGTIKVSQALGQASVDSWLRRFGIGVPTGLGFPGESAGLLLPVEDWSGTSIGSIPIGQGVSVTAVQMLGVYNAIANRGVLVEPSLVRAVVGDDGVEHPVPAPEERRVVSARTAAAVTSMLTGVVARTDGTGVNARIDGYAVAGKTGTAYKLLPGGTYVDGAGDRRYVASFAGFVPAQAPQLSAIVVLDEPTPRQGGASAAPVFARIAQYGLRQLRIPPPSSGGAVTPIAQSAVAATSD